MPKLPYSPEMLGKSESMTVAQVHEKLQALIVRLPNMYQYDKLCQRAWNAGQISDERPKKKRDMCMMLAILDEMPRAAG